ncbi:uncharacterized protein LOC135200564 [Macrobrachium nipponense]|uniref:uncharacterized protein LOC135200564 n=1 Tax=Macrobrachium nipponense TaxID=159736 RepID=UPI0030C802C2
MKISMLTALVGTICVASAAPQFNFNNEQPLPYSFAYGVNSLETGDIKEHKETVSPSGVTEGEYRWLQPNGLFRVTRYTADNGGYRAVVSEEAGTPVATYYTNSLQGSGPSQGSVITSFRSNNQAIGGFQPGNLVISRAQDFQNQGFTNSPNFQNREFTSFQNQDFRSPRITISQGSSNGQTFQDGGFPGSQVFQNQGNVIDGGIIDGGIIDGGVSFIDGGVTISSSSDFEPGFNRFVSNQNNFNANLNANFGPFGDFNRFDNSGFRNRNINGGTAVVLASNQNRFLG